MTRQLTVISGNNHNEEHRTVPIPQDKTIHLRNVICSVLEDAEDTWAQLWKELVGDIGVAIPPDMEKGFRPECGWPEFLEKMWLLKHYINYAKRFSEGKV